jgi:hypothetical protein
MAEAASPPAGGQTSEELAKLADTLRNRVDLFGKALAGIATIGTGAVGLASVSDLSPLRGWDYLWALIALAALLAAAVAAIDIAIRLMQVNQPIVIDVDLATSGLQPDALNDAQAIFQQAAQRLGSHPCTWPRTTTRRNAAR